MPEFEIDGRKFTCRKWKVRDVIEFNEIQQKLDDLDWKDARGKKANDALNVMFDYIAKQLDIPRDELLDWDFELTNKVMAGIIQANSALPKVPAAAAPFPPSPESSTQTTELLQEQSQKSTASST